MTQRRERKGSLLPPNLTSQKTTPNPSALPLDNAPAATVEPAPAPVQTVVESAPANAMPEAKVEPEPKPDPVVEVSEPVEPAPNVAAPVAEVATAPAPKVQTEPEPASASTSQIGFVAPKHRRSTKEKSSQMSVQVPPKLYKLVDNARREVQGLTGQTMLIEGLVIWLLHNEFITPEEGAELLHNPS